jgi:phosphohistidine phosphatase
MSMQIILIRHGIAESASPDRCDFDRALTEKGRKRLKDTLPALISCIQFLEKILIWSSPLVRARETAEIAAEIFRVESISYHDCIGEGNRNKLGQELHKLQPSEDCTLIIVGHEPDMGRWAEALCGEALTFGKGAAAGISYVVDRTKIGTLPMTGTLQFFYQPEQMEKLSGLKGS